MIVVSDTSAVTALLQVDRAELLASLYGTVFLPNAVREELRHTHPELPAFLHVVPVKDVAACARLAAELDDGEAEAIVLAKELKADYLLIDEAEGRRIAIREGLRIIGLMGTLLEAKRRGLIPLVRDLVEEIERTAHFRVDDGVKDYIYREAGEA